MRDIVLFETNIKIMLQKNYKLYNVPKNNITMNYLKIKIQK